MRFKTVSRKLSLCKQCFTHTIYSFNVRTKYIVLKSNVFIKLSKSATALHFFETHLYFRSLYICLLAGSARRTSPTTSKRKRPSKSYNIFLLTLLQNITRLWFVGEVKLIYLKEISRLDCEYRIMSNPVHASKASPQVYFRSSSIRE